MKKISPKQRQKYLKDCAQQILGEEQENYIEWCYDEGWIEPAWEDNADKHIYATAMVASYTPKELQAMRVRDYDEALLLEHGFIKPNSINFIKSLKNSMSRKK